MTDKQKYMESLSHRLLSTGRWSWGIGVPSLDGWLACDVDARGGIDWYRIEDGDVSFMRASDCPERLPDLEAPAAIGWLTKLVRDVTGRVLATHYDGFTWVVLDEDLHEVSGGDSEPESLIAAIEAHLAALEVAP